MRKILNTAALLSVLLIISMLLSSCGVFYFTYSHEDISSPNADGLEDIKDPDAPGTQTPPSQIDFGLSDKFDPTAILGRFHDYNFGGSYITIATASEKNPLFPSTGLYVDSNLYSAMSALQEKFNMSLTKFPSDLETLIATLENAETSGNNYADIVAIPLSAVPSFEGKDIFHKISSLPFISEDADYFAENKNFGITGEYFIGGSASYQISDTKVIFFNTDLIKSLGAVSPYSILSSKKWTWDKLYEYLTFGKGFALGEDLLAVIKATAGEKSEDTDAVAAALTEKILPSVISENAKESFLNGEALFYLGSLAEANEFSKTDTVFGLLPIPLFEEGKEYKSLHHSDDITVFACAKSSPDLERAAFIISAANASCYGSMESLFFSVTENSFLRDNGSNLSLGYICSAEISVIFPEVESETPGEDAE
ncbi:MAG: extracellular solute-binding protein [Clostridia bacterium]|nr:extracellular solute-binding protein [Clostridia bacterium]